jgi:hypothetical protein
MVRDVPRLVRSEMALATSVGPTKAAIVFDIVIASSASTSHLAPTFGSRSIHKNRETRLPPRRDWCRQEPRPPSAEIRGVAGRQEAMVERHEEAASPIT